MDEDLELLYAGTTCGRTIFNGDAVTVRIGRDAQPRRFRVTFEPKSERIVTDSFTLRLDPLF